MFQPSLPTPQTPLYNHRLPEIEQWLKSQGCKQDPHDLHLWRVDRPTWTAELWLDTEELTILYVGKTAEHQKIQRTFKYSLSRQDIEDAVFSGP
jgi:hypothetical protein